ncbi:hypothetical protein GCM10010330_16350 [Streptomyces tendae]|uniref:hypothetical protein n=1 Tax=Streptomyces tendae TaxID=1932 RepID=UPI0016754CEE|nr:hypothetical protein [Streptomyces tendae]GHA64267.1 hypothetical protein GCM10010330_16350 [Streptomyces tendae]
MAEQSDEGSKRHTTPRPIRVPDPLWQAYGRVCDRLGTDRTNDVLEHMKARIREHGTAEDQADLDRAERELAERRARKGGRPARASAEPE